jgi:arylsulfate sulfotransferase
MRLRIALAASLLSASFLQTDRTPPALTSAPAIARNPNPAAPLAAILTFDTDEPAVSGIELNGSGVVRAESQASTHHVVPVVGLIAGALNSIRITLTDSSGNTNSLAGRLEYNAPPLPADFPPLRTSVLDQFHLTPGFTIFNVTPLSPPAYGLIVAVNSKGQVGWYYRTSGSVGALSQTARGTLLFLEGTDAVEIDMLGNRIAHWHPTGAGIAAQAGDSVPVATNLFHHEIVELPGGNLLSLSHELRRMDSFPSSESDQAAPPAPATLVGDTIVEFSRDGRIVHEWSLLNLLDTQRIGYDSLSNFWDSVYRQAHGPTRDWTHANSVAFHTPDNAFIVSLRSQDAVVKVSRDEGKLLWIFGVPGDWKPPWSGNLLLGPETMRWPYHQHAASITSRGTLILFDNGNHQARPFNAKQSESQSRAAEFAIDEKGRAAAELWTYGGSGDEPFFSGTLGGVEVLTVTGNVLITDGARQTGNSRWARIVEVTHTKPAQKVFELIIGEPQHQAAAGWSVYRATHIDSFYRGTGMR